MSRSLAQGLCEWRKEGGREQPGQRTARAWDTGGGPWAWTEDSMPVYRLTHMHTHQYAHTYADMKAHRHTHIHNFQTHMSMCTHRPT